MARSTKAQREANGLLGITVALIIFTPFLFFSFLRFSLLKDQYLKSIYATRVVDIAGMKSTLMACAGYILFSGIGLGMVLDKSKVLGFMLIIIIVGIGILLGMRLAVVYLGAVIDDNKDMIVFPPDFQSFTITDYFSSKIIESFYSTDNVSLSDIFKMTRQAGKYLYIHGDFGSRKLAFSSKQKRDECIATIQSTENYTGEMIRELEYAP
jgi:hypothetical protein